MADQVDRILQQWAKHRPDLDVSPMAIVGRLARLNRIVNAEQTRTFTRHGLDPSAFDMLATLRRSGPPHQLTPAQLTRSSMVTSGAITQRLDRLEARGLVIRTPSETDGRVVDVSLTDAGRALIDQVVPDHVATGRQLLAGLDETDREDLARLMRKLLESLGDQPD